ncbi:uncharacterized protein LOC117592010 [Drosophila guanche]|uniref:Lethal hybrid rescue protein n=1 Tax=Drosophila guanche TaxID=7266 RepID=A0A3B0J1C9_DROGU|nr:uncharacterized protein LOC117592010 [Drosophila guanche]SPP74685.1 Hypothetical predicted protein [Drosophila guanche]
MDRRSGEDAASVSPMEINISNTNFSSMIVVNDLLLLKLIIKYPFLYGKAAQSEQESDYDEWAWKQITDEFNASYENLPLSTPFTAEELQWRWNILLPVIDTLSKTSVQVPIQLFDVVSKIARSLSAENVEPPLDVTMSQNFLLAQLPLVESMTMAERRRLEVECLDVILQHELETRATVPVGPKEKARVKVEYDEFLKSIQVKEMHLSPQTQLSLNGRDVKPVLVQANRAPASATRDCSSQNSNLVISGVFSAQNVRDPAPAASPSKPQMEAIDRAPSVSPPLDINAEVEVALAAIEHAIKMENKPAKEKHKSPGKKVTAVAKTTDSPLKDNPRHIPIKSAKYYTKKVRVRVKRVDLDDFMPLASIKRKPMRRK